MRLLVISDVHERPGALWRVLEEQPNINGVIFLGDGLRHAENAAREYPDLPFYMVPGNCDLTADLPAAREETFGGKRVFFTHGHKYRVKYGMDMLMQEAVSRRADIVLFGHTHRPYEHYEDGIHYLNPGSLMYGGTYGYVDITPAGILTGIVELK